MATNPQALPLPPRVPRLLIVGVLIALGIAAAGTAAYVLRGNFGAAQAVAPKAPQKPIFVTLEPVTVNLQAEGRGRFLHVGLALRVRDEKAQARIVESMPELRSRVLLLLSNRDPESLSSTEDKAKLAEEIRSELDRPLAAGRPAQGIASVAFNAFVVQ